MIKSVQVVVSEALYRISQPPEDIYISLLVSLTHCRLRQSVDTSEKGLKRARFSIICRVKRILKRLTSRWIRETRQAEGAVGSTWQSKDEPANQLRTFISVPDSFPLIISQTKC